VNAQRLRQHLEGLSVHGRPTGGSFADGVNRVAFSDADVEGRAYVIGLIEKAGLEPRIDAAGNILARREGRDPALAPVLLGSHIDSVPEGGNFDGPLGTLAALEALWVLGERGLTTRRPLELVVWVNEEGVAYGNGLFGSRAAAGQLTEAELDHVWEGVRKADAVRKLGGDPDRLATALRPEGSVHCYLELHVEQGAVLDKAGIPIGVVEGIVSIDRHDVVIRGMANHAGTTPMPDRKDAMIAAAHVTLAVHEIVTGEPGRQVGTVGKLEVSPGAPNVVPGLVRHTIELRDLSSEKIARLARAIEARLGEIAARTGTEITMTQTSHHEGALAAPEAQEAIEAAAARLGLACQRMPSGAGHDAQVVASFAPMGMIFVPSVGGISHSPREWTRWEDCAHGADVLLGAAVTLAS
jgi:N-carbamoyl-L-amino-acid hydrolase